MTLAEDRLHQAVVAATGEQLTPAEERRADVWGLTAERINPQAAEFIDAFIDRVHEVGLIMKYNREYSGIFLSTEKAEGLAQAEIDLVYPLDTLEWYRYHWDGEGLANNWRYLGVRGGFAELRRDAEDLRGRLMLLADKMIGYPFVTRRALAAYAADQEDETNEGISAAGDGLTVSIETQDGDETVLGTIPDYDETSLEAWDGRPMTDDLVQIISDNGFFLFRTPGAHPEHFIVRFIADAPCQMFVIDNPLMPLDSLIIDAARFSVWRKPLAWRGQSPAPGVYLLDAARTIRQDIQTVTKEMLRVIWQERRKKLEGRF